MYETSPYSGAVFPCNFQSFIGFAVCVMQMIYERKDLTA